MRTSARIRARRLTGAGAEDGLTGEMADGAAGAGGGDVVPGDGWCAGPG